MKKAQSSCFVLVGFLLFSLPVFACQVVEGSVNLGDMTNELKNYLYFTITTVALTLVIYFLRKRKGLIAVGISLLCLVFHPGWQTTKNAYLGAACDFPMLDRAVFLFAVSLCCLFYQLVFFTFRRKKLDAEMS